MKKYIFLLFLALFSHNSGFLFGKSIHTQATLHSEMKVVQKGTSFWVGVFLEMEETWHTYWKNAGDSGGPTHIDWSLPKGLTAGPIQWPSPKRIEIPPLVTFGYEENVFLLNQIKVSPSYSGPSQVKIRAHVRWLECADVCIPGEARLMVPVQISADPSQINPDQSKLFSEGRAKLPLREAGWSIDATDKGKIVSLILTPPEWEATSIGKLDFFPEDKGLFTYSRPVVMPKRGGKKEILIRKVEGSTVTLSHLSGLLIRSEGWRGRGSEKSLSVSTPVKQGQSSPFSALFWIALLSAFIGGLLLNLMPCVLPVISIKLLGLVKQSRLPKQEQKRHGLLYGAGILFMFWLLLGILLFLRAQGQQRGWGFQLQHPAFVAVMAAFFHLFGMNLFGVFEVGTSLLKVEDILRSSRKKLSADADSFLSGILATIVATPCTAPFMGSALGFALVQPGYIAFVVFTALAFGMALPYLLLTFYPKWISKLPKPGPWMVILKQVLAFLMWATTLWLMWVFGLQVGVEGVISLLAGLLIITIAVWMWGNWAKPTHDRKLRRGSALIALIVFLFGAYWVIYSSSSTNGKGKGGNGFKSNGFESSSLWKPFTPEALQTSLNQENPIFIDFTASWCLTCQVNKRVALHNKKVLQKFREKNVVLYKADWTQQNDSITRALQSYGRSGVPAYVLYGKGTPKNYRLLPEILTPGILLAELDSL